jgi:hypothetical protein
MIKESVYEIYEQAEVMFSNAEWSHSYVVCVVILLLVTRYR